MKAKQLTANIIYRLMRLGVPVLATIVCVNAYYGSRLAREPLWSVAAGLAGGVFIALLISIGCLYAWAAEAREIKPATKGKRK